MIGINRKRPIIAHIIPLRVGISHKEDRVVDIQLFTEVQIDNAALSITCGKGPGQAEARSSQSCGKCTPELIANIMNSLLKPQKVFDGWRVAKIILLFQSQKSPEISSFYRSLRLLNSLSNFLEALIKNRLLVELEANGGLHES